MSCSSFDAFLPYPVICFVPSGMTRSRLNSETHEETQKSILKNGKGSANLTSMEPSVSASNDGDKPKDTDVPEQTTIHAYEKHQRTAGRSSRSPDGCL